MTEEKEKYETDVTKWEERHPVEKGVLVQANSPGAMISLAVSQGADLGHLERVLALQIKWEENEAKKAYVEAMAAFKVNPPEIEKDKTVSFPAGGKTTSYTHASLANVTRKINDGLSKHGLSAGWSTKQENGNITVTCKITHKMGHSEETSLTAAPDNSGSKNAIQAIGSAISYLERYTILALCGLATADMDDNGNTTEVKYITEDQLIAIQNLMMETNSDEKKFLAYLKIDKLEEMPAGLYGKALAALEKKKGKKNDPA